MNCFTAQHLETMCFAFNKEIKCVHSNALLTQLKDVPEQGVFKRLQLPERSGVISLPLAL